jgi:DNA-binding transcriptional MocR family regulator
MERKTAFLIVTKEVLADKRFSATTKLLLAQLRDHRNRRTGQCYPRQATLARELGVSVDTVQRSLNALRQAGWLTVFREQYGCRYEIQIPQNAVSQTAKCGAQIPQNAVSELPGPLYEPDLKEPSDVRAENRRAPAASRSKNKPQNPARPLRKSAQSETLEAYYREERRKAGQS